MTRAAAALALALAGCAGLFAAHPDVVCDAAISAEVAVTCDLSNQTLLWPLRPNGRLPALVRPRRAVPGWAAAFSPDGRLLALAGASVWTPASLTLWHSPGPGQDLRRAHDAPPIEPPSRSGHVVRCLTWSPDSRWLAAGGDWWVGVWRVAPGPRLVLDALFDAHPAATVFQVAFSPDGRWLLSASDDGSIRAWGVDPEGRGVLHHERPIVLVEGAAVTTIAIDRRGRWLAADGKDDTLRLWRIRFGPERPEVELVVDRQVHGGKGYLKHVAFRPDGTLVSAGPGGRLWRIHEDGDGVRLIELERARTYLAGAFALSPDGTWALLGNNYGQLWTWVFKH